LKALRRQVGLAQQSLYQGYANLDKWRHLLEGHPHKVKVWTDHANLTRYREGQALSDKHKRYLLFLTWFDFEFYHIPGKDNITADALSWRSDLQPAEGEEPKEVLFPDHMFIKLIRPVAMEENIWQQHTAAKYQQRLQHWERHFKLTKKNGLYWKEGALTVPNYENIAQGLMEVFHDGLTAGHLGQLKTWLDIKCHYWWPSMRKTVQEYVQGCAICQANKIITHRNKPPLFPIEPEKDAQPFEVVVMDLIVKLPESQGYDSILTITDHDCTKGVILVPCKEEMTAKQLAQEYKSKVFPYAGILKKIISDRDTRFTSKFAKEVCAQLQIRQNISTAYHPQTDGQSEKTNQHVETLLRIFCNFQQNDWADHLPIVQYILNARVSTTTKQAPFELWMGHIPWAHQPDRLSNIPHVEWHKDKIQEVRRQAQESMKRAQELWAKERLRAFSPYQKNDKVWLEAKN
jgi:Integrase zinc binding domain